MWYRPLFKLPLKVNVPPHDIRKNKNKTLISLVSLILNSYNSIIYIAAIYSILTIFQSWCYFAPLCTTTNYKKRTSQMGKLSTREVKSKVSISGNYYLDFECKGF